MLFTPGWSVGWYFIPIANLWKPYQAVKEIWIVSHKNTPADHAVVGWWWALLLISNLLFRIAFQLDIHADTASSYMTSTMAYIISDGFDLILNAVALTMVTRIGNAYTRYFVEQAVPGYPPQGVGSPEP